MRGGAADEGSGSDGRGERCANRARDAARWVNVARDERDLLRQLAVARDVDPALGPLLQQDVQRVCAGGKRLVRDRIAANLEIQNRHRDVHGASHHDGEVVAAANLVSHVDTDGLDVELTNSTDHATKHTKGPAA